MNGSKWRLGDFLFNFFGRFGPTGHGLRQILSLTSYSTPPSIYYRYITDARFYIRIATIYEIFGTSNLVVMIFMPVITGVRRLPFIFWLPFDPLTSSIRYYFAYMLQAMCALIAGGINLCANMYIFIVFICFNFNFGLLSARIKQIGYSDLDGRGRSDDRHGTANWAFDRSSPSRIDCYREVIEHINVHMKING